MEDYLASNGYKIISRFPDSHNLVYLVQEKEGNYVVLKTHQEREIKLIQNEESWLKLLSELDLGFQVPRLLNAFEADGKRFLTLEFIQGESLQEKIDNGSFGEVEVSFLASFCKTVEELSIMKAPRSEEKLALKSKDWDEIFKKNLISWHSDLVAAGFLENDILEQLKSNAEKFEMSDDLIGGIHGSSKMREFIVNNGKYFVLDWETASSVYIKYYQTAGIASFLAVRLGRVDLAKMLIQKRFNQKIPIIFKAIFSQRLLGDLWDLNARKREITFSIEQLVELLNQI